VLDEPNANLDEGGEHALLRAIAQLKQQRRTIILITHKPNVLSLTDQLLILKDGQMQAFGPTARVLEARQKPAAAKPVSTMSMSYRLGEGKQA